MKTNKNISFLIRILEFIRSSWKYFFFAAYIGIAALGWSKKNEALNLIPIGKNTFLYSVYQMSFAVFYLLIFLLLLIGIVQWLKTPVYLKWKFKKGFKKIGFKNSAGEVPILISQRNDKNKSHGVIYKFKNMGLSVLDFDNNIHQIQTIFNGIVYEIVYSKRRMSQILLYVIPKKYDVPKIISPDDDFLCTEPNFLCTGKTCSGKSFTLFTILGKYALRIPNVSITICDYKKSSFAQFEGMPNFFGYENVPDGIRTFYKEFCERLAANDEQRNKKVRVLLIDEYGALISAQDKKEAEALKSMVGEMLFMGRSLGLRVLIGVQSAYSELFRAGARDQFRVILGLGNLSKEQKNMLFFDYKEEMTAINNVGEGYLFIDGQGIERVKIANINETDKIRLNDAIKNAMNR